MLAILQTPLLDHGLGRAALEFFIEQTGSKVYAIPHDGQRLDDGSHLTGDAPGFVFKMQEEAIILPDNH